MKNKKFLKAVAAVTMSGLTAFGAFGLAACGGHSHDYSEWGGQDEAQHYKYCAEDDEKDPDSYADHDYTNGNCVCGKVKPKEYETVVTKVDIAAALIAAGGESGKSPNTTSDMTVGRLTYGAGVYFESSNSGLTGACVNNQQKKISFELNGVDNENSIKFEGKGGSSMALKLYKEDGTVVKDFGTITSVQNLSAEGLPAGRYYLQSVGSGRLANIVITEKLEKSAPTGISISGGTKKFLKGRAFDVNGLSVMLNYSNGRQDSLTTAKYTVDSSGFNKDVPGTYEISVTYNDNPEYKQTYTVAVYGIESITAYDYSVDSKRVTQNVQKLFKTGDTFNSANLAVQATCSTPGVEAKETFVLKSSEYTVTNPEMTAGAKTVNIEEKVSDTAKKTVGYGINVVDLSAVDGSQVSVTVDASAAVGVSGNVVTVNSVNDALRVFKLAGTADDAVKNITVAEGGYKEKVEIDLPNVHVTGANVAGDATKSVIWYDALNGVMDPSGTTSYNTDGSASVSIRAEAVGFKAENITFKNYWNTNALYEESKTVAGSGTQAVAVLVQADKCVFDNVTFLGYHDTLYDMTGRHVYNNCHIEGRTDYIFGYNSTAYFNRCTIKTIGAGLTEKNGGYVVATKGMNKGESDSVEYGYIFDNCTFTDDGNVQAGTVSLARGWDKYMTLAFINNEMSGAYSKEKYGEATVDPETGTAAKDNKNDRYTKMNADPVAAKLFEYGNTGDGALDYTALGVGTIDKLCTIIDETRARDFSDVTKIFAATNGKMTYADAWDGTLD